MHCQLALSVKNSPSAWIKPCAAGIMHFVAQPIIFFEPPDPALTLTQDVVQRALEMNILAA